MPLLSVDHGPDKGLSHKLSGRMTVTGGRAADNTLCLHDTMVSSRHFRIEYAGDQVTLFDLGSTNGTFFNGERLGVDGIELKIGDVFQAGETYISVLADEDDSRSKRQKALKEIPGFEIIERVGVGGMGVVYRARQISLDREVAIKVLSPKLTKDRALVERFLSEARAAGQLTHANIVQVHDVGERDGLYYICMEYVGGGSLIDLLREQGRVDVETSVRIALDVARGLEFAEIKRIVHCDIKPENIMLTDAGMAKIADLGIARQLAEEAEDSEEVLGSPHYMSPEQAQGKAIDHRTDLYALGCTLFRMLAGRTPFSGTNAKEIMRKQVYDQPPNLREITPEVTEQLADVVYRLMAKDPDERYQSAALLVKDLERIKPSSASAGPEPRDTRKRPPVPPKPRVMPGGPLRTTARVRRQRTSSSAAFLPFALGVVLLGFGVYAVMFYAMPDRGAQALRKAEQLASQQRYEDALLALRGKGSSNSDVALRMMEMKKYLNEKIREQQADQRFRALWQDYLNLKSSNPGTAQLRNALNRLKMQYGHLPDKQAIIDRELNSL